MRQLDETLNLLAEQDPSVDTAELIIHLERRLATEGVPVVAIGTSDDRQLDKPSPVDSLKLRSRRTWTLAAGFVAAALIIGLPLWLASGTDPRVGDQEVVSTPVETPDAPDSDRGVLVEPAEVFDLATDSLCDWFTAEEMNEIVAGAQARVGTDFEFERFVECWRTPFEAQPVDSGQTFVGIFMAWGSPGWAEGTDIPGAVMVGLSDPSQSVPENAEFERHAMLDPSVSYAVIRYTVAYDAGLQVQLQVAGHEEPLLFLLGVGDAGAQSTPKYEDLGLAIANELLRRLNWIEDTEPALGDDDQNSAPVSDEVFGLAAEPLCELFAADQLDEIVAGAQARVGTDFAFEPFDPAACSWLSDSGPVGQGFRHSSAGWSSGTGDDIPGEVMVGLSDSFLEETPPAAEFISHELLDPSVSYSLVRYAVAFDAGLRIHLRVDGHDQVLDFAFGVGDAGAVLTPKYEDLGLAIANELLRRMNWVSGPDGGVG